MSRAGAKQCVVAYAGAARQYLWVVALPAEASIAEAIESARHQAQDPEVPWDSAPVGIFGELRSRADLPADGDRIELYRPLRSDPRERRRVQSVRRSKASQ
ncbi:MAG: RnfH family protein [Gammaproteobacteria bacterium]|nr:RnfH family protein [Gammaproteobacteria bacterium]